MATTNNILLKLTSGTIGKQIIIKNYGDKVVISKHPNMDNRRLSPKQKASNQLMMDANFYAREIIGTPPLKDAALLRLKVLENKLYRALVKEYMLKKGDIELKGGI